MNKKIALITGVTGQDGAYLARFLIKKNYIVHGIKRRSSLINTKRIDDIYKDKHYKKSNFILHYGDVTDGLNINNLVSKIKPDEIYNLAAQSHVQVSFQIPFYTTLTNSMGTLNILESIKSSKLISSSEPDTKFVHMVGFESEHYDVKTNELITVSEEWGFEKDKNSKDPNWKLFSIKVVS